MFNRKKKLSLWERIRAFFVGLWWSFRAIFHEAQLANPDSDVRTEAQRAIDRVVFETQIPPDCVKAMFFRGAPNIQISHDPFTGGATATMINGESYNHAAERAIEWITANSKGDLTFHGATVMRRKDRRAFNSIRKRVQKRH